MHLPLTAWPFRHGDPLGFFHHFQLNQFPNMWSTVLTSLRLRPLQTVEHPLAEADAENAEKSKERKKKSALDKIHPRRRKRVLKNNKVPKDKDNIVGSNETTLTESYEGDETWDGQNTEERNEEHVTDSLSNVESGPEQHERLLGQEVEGNSTSNQVVVEAPGLAAPASLERRKSELSSSSSPSSRIPPNPPGQSRRQKRNAKRKQKTLLGTGSEKSKTRSDAKKKKEGTKRQVEESRPADDSEMPENGAVEHVEIIEEEAVPSTQYPLVRSMYASGDDADCGIYESLYEFCVVKDDDTLYRLGFPRRQMGSMAIVQFSAEHGHTPLTRVMTNPTVPPPQLTPAAATRPFQAPSLQNPTSNGYAGYENLNFNNVNGNGHLVPLASSSRPPWEGEKICTRCSVRFTVTETGEQCAFPTTCQYHWDNTGRHVNYQCCGKRVIDSPACCTEEQNHVYQHKVVGEEIFPHPHHGFISTTKKKTRGKSKASRDVVALDCEMVYTVAGLKLAQVVVVDVKGLVKYSSYVRPYEKILSYNSEHSGVRKEHLEGPRVKSLPEVQKDLQNGIITARTIIIGHALHNDIKQLKLLHNLIVDTQVLYRLTGIRGLRDLALLQLHIDIQNSYDGHDCAQDARAALDLALRYAGEQKQGSKENLSPQY